MGIQRVKQRLVQRPSIQPADDRTDCDICYAWNVSSHKIGDTYLCQVCVNEIAKAATTHQSG